MSDIRQKAIEVATQAAYKAPYRDNAGEQARVDALAVVDALIAAGFIRETDNTGNDIPFVAVGFEGGMTFALTGENAGHWVEGEPTHVELARSSGVADTMKEENKQ